MNKRDVVQSRLNFLKAAAHILAIRAPTTSATLGVAHDRLLEEQGADLEAPTKEWNALRREVCGACGSLLMPGRTCEVSQQSLSRRIHGGDKKSPRVKPEKAVVYSCSRCNRKTIQSLPERPSRQIRQTRQSAHRINITDVSLPHERASETAISTGKSANVSSKQRKKTRKGGLQALLEKSKTEQAESLKFDLMDFMQ